MVVVPVVVLVVLVVVVVVPDFGLAPPARLVRGLVRRLLVGDGLAELERTCP